MNTPEAYIKSLPEDRKAIIQELRNVINKNIPDGFEETITYGMIGWVVPHSLYPAGYHVTPELPLPFISIASQKNHIALYHMGVYSDDKLLNWFSDEYPKYIKTKLNMGKSCIRFNPKKELPLKLIGKLCTKITVDQWISIYERQIK